MVVMQKVTFLSVGRTKTPWIADGCRHFAQRLSTSIDLHSIEIPASRQLDEDRQRAEESQVILERLDKLDGDVWLLDERGKGMKSVDFSKVLGRAQDSGRPLIFILGGAYGVTDAVRNRATNILQLSQMTFPHEFCCLVFLEQLYRACEILKGSGYHH